MAKLIADPSGLELKTHVRNTWPEEWFDGQARLLTLDDLNIKLTPEDEGYAQALAGKRQSLKHRCASLGLTMLTSRTDHKGKPVKGIILQAVKQ